MTPVILRDGSVIRVEPVIRFNADKFEFRQEVTVDGKPMVWRAVTHRSTKKIDGRRAYRLVWDQLIPK